MKYPLSLDALEVLDTIARKGSFAAAADELHRVPSAISYSVQKVEQDLKVSLFRKQGRRSVLTDAGKVLLEQGRELLAASEQIAIATKKAHNGWYPVFNLAIDSRLNVDFIYPLIVKFYELYPNIEINIFEEDESRAIDGICSRRVDLVVGIDDDLIPAQGIRYQSIGEIEWVFVVAAGHELASMTLPVSDAMLEQFRFVITKDSSRNQIPQSRRYFTEFPVLSVPTIAEKIKVLKQGLGIGFLPVHRIRDELESGALIALSIDNSESLQKRINMAWKVGNKSKVLSWFIEQIAPLSFPC